MGAKTVQNCEEMLDVLVTFFHRNIMRGLVEPGKRLALDVYRLLQVVKDNPQRFDEFLGVLDGTHEIKLIDHVIDLGSPCDLPFDGLIRMSPPKSGVVKLERRADTLYLDGKPLNLFLSRGQKNGNVIGGHDLHKEIGKRGNNVSAKVLDHLVAHPELWPESWKKDAQGNTVYVFFWDDIFRDPANGRLCVRCGYWRDGEVVSYYSWLGSGWHGDRPAASSAS
jgi:hypothetical protein